SFPRVSLRGEYNACRTSLAPLDIDLLHPAFEHGFADLNKVRFQPYQDRLRFRVAKTNIVFQQFRPGLRHHQSQEHHTLELKALAGAGVEGRHYYPRFYFGDLRGVEKT